jgi:SNF2 family DNA or RNA helicase
VISPRSSFCGLVIYFLSIGTLDESEVLELDKAAWGFALRTAALDNYDSGDRFDLLIATDVLAEGVNLQQSRHIVNYDLPWNPMHLVQRHGRIDRLLGLLAMAD